MKFQESSPGIAMACGHMAVNHALSGCGYQPPKLWVAPDRIGFARDLARSMGINYDLDDELTGEQWYVEWQGKLIGSIGA